MRSDALVSEERMAEPAELRQLLASERNVVQLRRGNEPHLKTRWSRYGRLGTAASKGREGVSWSSGTSRSAGAGAGVNAALGSGVVSGFSWLSTASSNPSNRSRSCP